jgi:hypothetical protein
LKPDGGDVLKIISGGLVLFAMKYESTMGQKGAAADGKDTDDRI